MPGKLFSVACRMLGNPTDAEDLLQEIFLSAHRKLDGFRGESALGTWLYRLATNHCLDYLRSRAARTNQLTDALDDEPGLSRRAAAGLAEQTVTKMDLERAMARLPEGCRAAFVLHDVRGSSTAKSPRSSASRKARRSRRCTRRGCGFARCCRNGLPSGMQDGSRTRARRSGTEHGTIMQCAHYRESIQEMIDGTLGAIRTGRARASPRRVRRAAARSLADLQAIRDAAGSLEPLAPPDGVWLQIAGRLRQEGRVSLPPARAGRARRATSRCWRSPRRCVLAVGASIVMLLPRVPANDAAQPAGASAAPQPGNAAADMPSKAWKTEFRLAEQHYQNAIAKLEQAARLDQASAGSERAIDPQTAAMLQKNLQVIDQAIAESRAALRIGAAERAGARQPVRRAQAKGGAAAGHDRADERDAQRQCRRRRPDRRRRQQVVASRSRGSGRHSQSIDDAQTLAASRSSSCSR